MQQLLKNHRALLALLLVTTAVYWNVYDAGFVWDDYALVQGNTMTDSWTKWPKLFTMDLWETPEFPQKSGFYRPLFLLSLSIDRGFFGLDPGPHHLHSLFWHLACVAMVYRLAATLKDKPTGLLAALFFALHPVQHEAVTLIAARNDSMATFFALSTLYLLLDKESPRRRMCAAAFCFSLALLSKESVVLLPVLLLVLDWARFGRPIGRRRYLMLAALVVGIFVLRASVGIEQPAFPDGAAAQKGFEHTLPILGTYAQLLVWPDPLTPARHIDYLDSAGQLAPFLLSVIALFGALIWRSKNDKLVWAGWIWALFGLAPSLLMTLDPTRGNLGERYLYWPMVGLCLSIAIALPRSRLMYGIIGAWALLSSYLIVQRHADWKDYNTLWSAAYRDRPSTYTAGGYAWSLANIAGNPEQAAKLYLEALEGEPVYKSSCDSIIVNQLRLGNPLEAAKIWEWSTLHRRAVEKRCPISRISLDLYALALLESNQDSKLNQLLSPEVKLPKPSRAPVIAHYALERDTTSLANLLTRYPQAQTALPHAHLLLMRFLEDSQSAYWLEELHPSLAR